MRVLQVTDYGSPYPGSFVPMLAAASEAARRRGWRMQVVLPARARQRDWLGQLAAVDVLFAPEAPRRGMTRWLEDLVAAAPGPTVLHSHFTAFDLPAVKVAAKRPDTRVFWHVHTVLGSNAAVQLRNRVKLSMLARRVELILCVAQHLADSVRARGAPAGKVRYFPNGLDVDAFQPVTHDRRRAARQRLGLPADATVLLHFGREWELKGGDHFLNAAKALEHAGRPRLVAATARGGIPARELAEQLGLQGIAVLDHVPDARDLYGAADLLMATSRGEGMPLTVLEALASGLPVVASDIPGHAIPGARLDNLVVAPLRPRALADAAAALLDRDRETAARAAQEARAWVREAMDLDAWAERLMALYDRSAQTAAA